MVPKLGVACTHKTPRHLLQRVKRNDTPTWAIKRSGTGVFDGWRDLWDSQFDCSLTLPPIRNSLTKNAKRSAALPISRWSDMPEP